MVISVIDLTGKYQITTQFLKTPFPLLVLVQLAGIHRAIVLPVMAQSLKRFLKPGLILSRRIRLCQILVKNPWSTQKHVDLPLYIQTHFLSTVAITSCVYIPVVSDIPARCVDDVRCND